jgi:hypothetical protein
MYYYSVPCTCMNCYSVPYDVYVLLLCPSWRVCTTSMSQLTCMYYYSVPVNVYVLLFCPRWRVCTAIMSKLTWMYYYSVPVDIYVLLFCPSWHVCTTILSQLTTDKISQQPENCENRNDPDLVQAFVKKWWVESDFKAPNLPLSLRFKGSGCHYNSI